jgi:hypothetical protein
MSDYISREAAIKELLDTYEREFPTADGAFDLFAVRIMPRVRRIRAMTIDRAIEILDPERREHYDGMDEVNEACRMGMEALERTRWIPCSERLPESDAVWQKYIVAYRYRYRDIWDDKGENAVVTVADYCHEQKVWSMDGGTVINALIDSEDVQPWASYITHWMPLPELPKEEKR